MKIEKIRFIEPGNLPYRKSIKNLYIYDKYIRTPSHGLMTLATIAKKVVDDTLMYSESISDIIWKDVLDADIVFIGIFTFSANRGYELAKFIKQNSKAIVVMGGLHASMNYPEAVNYCDYVLLGEGDESIGEFIEAVQNSRDIDFPGVAYMSGNKIVIQETENRRRTLILFLTGICCTIIKKWQDITLSGLRFMPQEDVPITAITVPLYVILEGMCEQEHPKMWWKI
ncbi:hypothetical protein [Pseudobacteroides cellulosolvens]|uniref:Cobalamin B12-binding domain protein n=1 Tax=Pseudobacteroides cellulosolvens ATCC 35603 = DSM 2933 TaxID=398512 RepID=A0A0L6JID4_9FIRM|nr:cobalamin B12-binding domain protein [Pseudobacteroides cellulosolvens ATCC 35603 = DSM 2933]